LQFLILAASNLPIEKPGLKLNFTLERYALREQICRTMAQFWLI